ncbi:hypothetical protein NMY22_g13510 [Coprinellus aureogranulatus]|nr:hypothetical protein NMY22_g13510 [Coprinellus aureogranulatus]
MPSDVIRPSSCTRRKPSRTYKSPTAAEWTTYAPCPSLHPKTSSQTPTPPPTRSGSITRTLNKTPSRSRQLALQLLPLYHPEGQLACSLPPLDPLSFGLEAPIILNEPRADARESSCRAARRKSPPPGPSLSATTVSAVAAVAAREIREKEKPSPRKRRTGGGGGKRKRKDNDSADTTYPAKRVRAPRNATATPVIEEESMNEMEANGYEEQDENEVEGEKLVERRTTRSRAGLKRQSSVNTTTSDTPSKGVSPGPPDVREDPAVHHDVEMKTPTPESEHVGTPTREEVPVPATTKERVEEDEKEEGELSDDGQ